MFDGVLQHRTVAADDRRADCAGDRHDVKIDGGRQGPIEAKLFVAVVAPRRENEAARALLSCRHPAVLVHIRRGVKWSPSKRTSPDGST
jgi:hypothetical protein